MMKHFGAVALATALPLMPQAAAHSIVQRSGWEAPRLESYLAAQAERVPWLDINGKAKRSKGLRGDFPIGSEVAIAAPVVLRPAIALTQISPNGSRDQFLGM